MVLKFNNRIAGLYTIDFASWRNKLLINFNINWPGLTLDSTNGLICNDYNTAGILYFPVQNTFKIRTKIFRHFQFDVFLKYE